MPLPKTHNELVEKIIDRVNELHGLGIRQLRKLHPDNLDGSAGGVQWAGVSKAELISGIVTEEFYQDIDYDLEDGHGINIGDQSPQFEINPNTTTDRFEIVPNSPEMDEDDPSSMFNNDNL